MNAEQQTEFFRLLNALVLASEDLGRVTDPTVWNDAYKRQSAAREAFLGFMDQFMPPQPESTQQ